MIRLALFALAFIASFCFNYFMFVKPLKSEIVRAIISAILSIAAIYTSSYLGVRIMFEETQIYTSITVEQTNQILLESMRIMMLPYCFASVICMLMLLHNKKKANEQTP